LLLAERAGRTPPRVARDGATTAPPTAPTAPADLRSLARQANRLYREAQDALKNGDWAAYGERMRRLEAILKQMEAGQ
jgi:uncharacterized membrane protein (UPF0182 family)